MSVVLLSLLAAVASAADLNEDGCEDSYFNANSACVSPDATIGSGTTIGSSASVGVFADLGADIALGASTTVSPRTTIVGRVSASGARPIGTGTVIGRSSFIGADHDIGQDNTIGRDADIGERLQTGNSVTVSYATQIGDDVDIGANTAIGGRAHIGNNTTVGASSVLARGVDIADSASAASIAGIIGPDVSIGAEGSVASTARIRKGAQLGANVTVLGGARIGRDVQIADGATIGANARLGAGVTVTANTLVPEDAVVQRGDTYDDPQSTDCVVPWLPVQGQGGLSNGIGTDTRWSIASSPRNYNSAVLTHNFTGDFEVIASWNSSATGIGIVHGDGVSYEDVTGYSRNGGGTYWDAITTTGFPSGYFGTYKGRYSVGTAAFVRWLRQGSTVSVQSSGSQSGPWSNITGSPFSVPSTDDVVIGIGEGSGSNTTNLLQLVSCTAN